jgi:predicted ATPase
MKITRLHIENLKCFAALKLPLGSLTLLTGFNAAGKSTAVQSLLLLAQAMRDGGLERVVPLNGDLVQLGSPGEALHEGGGKELTVGIESETAKIDWVLSADDRSFGHALTVARIDCSWHVDSSLTALVIEGPTLANLKHLLPAETPEDLAKLRETVAEALFISAVRDGASDTYPTPQTPNLVHADVGVHGEYAAWWLERCSDDPIATERINLSETVNTLRRQANAWLGQIFPGAQANAARIPKTQMVQLEFRNRETDNWRRPANIGYGLTYAFPIIVAGLLAKKGQVIVVDSPEAHLHPLGQSQMGLFLATLAASGVQIIVETHSDHVLNGVRLAVKNTILAHDEAMIHFFNPRPKDASEPAHVISPQIDPQGNVSNWPSGFFDQAEKDLAALAGWL